MVLLTPDGQLTVNQNQRNAHPHSSSTGKIALVHNGIIENYQILKSKLIDSGYEFNSDTDSEVLANLIDFFFR